MVVLFLKENSVAIIERISMDGGPYSRKTLFQDDEIDNIENFSLHHMRETHWTCLLDKQTNTVKYFLDKKSGYYQYLNI